MEYLSECKLLCNATNKDFLNFAPCPPPWLSFNEFRDYILTQNLSMPEVCTIAERCKVNAPDTTTDCPLTPTTTTMDDFSPITSDDNSLTLSITMGVFWPVAAIVVIFIVLCYRGKIKCTRHSKDAVTEKENAGATLDGHEMQCIPNLTKGTTTESGSKTNIKRDWQGIKTTTL